MRLYFSELTFFYLFSFLTSYLNGFVKIGKLILKHLICNFIIYLFNFLRHNNFQLIIKKNIKIKNSYLDFYAIVVHQVIRNSENIYFSNKFVVPAPVAQDY